ncbi:MAG TPA: hypothetical protein VNU46_02705 [Gemmatimonadaceae bacterium]|nr:hypothetical protein [Gemmatimonadaceae bacterium]
MPPSTLKPPVSIAAPAALATPPRFAAVEVTVPVVPPSSLLGPPERTTAATPASAVTIALRLPQGVETTVTGLDADATTLLILELVSASARQ